MKNTKVLPISIATIILVVFCAISFLTFDASESVAIRGVAGSYAESFAKDNNVEFIAIADSENDKIDIPVAEEKENTTENKEDNKSDKNETTEQQKKENDTFSYNYDDKTVSITVCKNYKDEIVIPETIDNLPVKSISFDVLSKGVKIVEIPESVTSIKADFNSARYTASFFTVIAIMALGYIFAIISTMLGFKKQQTAEDTFYGVPFVYSGMTTYIFVTVFSAIALFLGFNPLLQIVIAIIIFAVAIGKLLKKSVARELIVEQGEQIKQQTAFIKMLTVDAQSFMSRASNDEMKAETKKIYEAIRYSDPMSNEALASIENQIQNEFNAFANAVKNNDIDFAKSSSNELVILINDRNNKCKVLK